MIMSLLVAQMVFISDMFMHCRCWRILKLFQKCKKGIKMVFLQTNKTSRKVTKFSHSDWLQFTAYHSICVVEMQLSNTVQRHNDFF